MTKVKTLLTSTAAALAFASVAHGEDVNLTVFDWAGFEEPSLITSFIAKHGMPTYAFFGDDDEAFQKVSSGFKADVAHPCSQMVQKYRDAGLIERHERQCVATLHHRQHRDPSIGNWRFGTADGSAFASHLRSQYRPRPLCAGKTANELTTGELGKVFGFLLFASRQSDRIGGQDN